MADTPQTQTAPLDLSAGLVPKESQVAPTTPGSVDLSAGLVPKAPQAASGPVDLSAGLVPKPVQPMVWSGYQTPGQKVVSALGNTSDVVKMRPDVPNAGDTGILSTAYAGLKNLAYNEFVQPTISKLQIAGDLYRHDTKSLQEDFRKLLFAKAVPEADADKLTAGTEQTGTNPVNEGKGLVSTAKNVANLPLAGQFHRKGSGPIEGETEDWISGQINPLNIALAVATMGGSAAESALVKIGVSAPKAAAVVKYASTAANLGFLGKMGWDIGQNAIPQAENAYRDFKAAKTPEEKKEAFDNLQRRLTDITLDSLAAGLASHGLTNSIAELHELSPNAKANVHTDYTDAIHDYQASKQIGSGQAQQFHRESTASVKSPVQREAVSNHIEANGDTQLLEQRARSSEANPETEQHTEGYDAAKNLKPEAASFKDRVTDVLEDWRGRLQNRGLISRGRENYVPHKWTFEETDPATGQTVEVPSSTPRDFLKERTFNTFHEGEQAGFEPATKDAAKLTADYIQKASNLLAKDDLANGLLQGKTTAGKPLAVKTSQLSSPDFADYQPVDLSAMKADGTLGRESLAVHTDIAQDLNAVLSKPGGSNFLLKLSQQAKGTLLSLSPFHAVMEGVLAGESGINPFGRAKESFFTRLPENVDYFNLTPDQTQAIRDGLNTMPAYNNYLSEGDTAGGKNLLINKLPLVGDLNSFMHERLFGQNGMITGLKFDLYGKLKPAIMDRYPNITDEQAGRIAASQVNNKFGGLNYELLGRDAGDQKILRTLLLAPDFLESRGRSVLDIAGKNGAPLAQRLLAFNVAHYLTARAINYLVSGDTHPEAGVSVLSKDGKREYSIRTTMGDFLHFIQDPLGYGANRINPVIRAGGELVTGRDMQGHKVSNDQKFWDIARQFIPLPAQALTPKQSITQQSAGDELLKSVGVGSKKVFTPAENLALQRQTLHSPEGEPLAGEALADQQKKHKLQDDLAQAIKANDAKAEAAAQKAIDDASDGPDAFLTVKAAKELRINAQKYPTRLEATVHRLDLESALDVWDVASQQERKLIASEIDQKIGRWEKTASTEKTPRQRNKTQERIDAFQKAEEGSTASAPESVEPIDLSGGLVPKESQAAEPIDLRAGLRPKTQPQLPEGATHYFDPATKRIHPATIMFRASDGSIHKANADQWPEVQKIDPGAKKVSPTDTVIGDPAKIPGMIKPGNLDLRDRPIIQNADGTHSSEYSTSFEDEQGHEVLVPTVVNGKFLTPDGKKPKQGSAEEKAMFKRAWQHYEQTGEHLGVFDTPEHADAYAAIVHNRKQ